MMKRGQQHSSLDGIRKEQLKRRVFAIQFKAEVVRHKKAENLSYANVFIQAKNLPYGFDLYP